MDPSHGRFPLSPTPKLTIVGISYISGGTSGWINSCFERNIAAVPERRDAATTQSGWRMLITFAQIPPPECPHRHQGIVATSGWPDFVAKSSKARRKTLSEPCLGS